MSNKYFVVSDIHSFYAPLKRSLASAGFRKTNKEHVLIVCGDVFDRGEETMEVYRFLSSLPKKRCILVKGNHESLFFELLTKQFPDRHDFSNGTVKTFCAIAGVDEELLSGEYYYKNNMGDGWQDRIRKTWRGVVESVKESKVYAWLCSDAWRNYYELGRFVFVHSFVPTVNLDGLPGYYVHHRALEEMSDWRERATDCEWDDARWGCPYKLYAAGLFKTDSEAGKTLVCGHWSTSDFRSFFGKDLLGGDGIYFSEHLIGLDGGVRVDYSLDGVKLVHSQNVMVIDEDGNCFDKFGQRLEEACSEQ